MKCSKQQHSNNDTRSVMKQCFRLLLPQVAAATSTIKCCNNSKKEAEEPLIVVVSDETPTKDAATLEPTTEVATILGNRKRIRSPPSTTPFTKSLLNDYLNKLTMFLVTTTVVVFSPNLLQPANCHKQIFQNNYNHHHHQHQPSLAGHEHVMLTQRQALDHLIRGQNHNNHYHHFVHHHQAADRRVSGADAAGGGSAPTSGAGQQHSTGEHNGNGSGSGKLLVCYYTTRQSAPYWPNDARGYVVPSEDIIGNNVGQSASSQQIDLKQSAPISGFSPMLHYEPFPLSQLRERDNQQQQQQAAEPLGSMKNQQQQLVFKSAAALQSGPNVGGRSGNLQQQQQQLTNTIGHHWERSMKSKQQYQEMFATESPLLASSSNQLLFQQPSFVLSQNVSNPLKSKQTPAYSFIGPDGNNNNNLEANINNNGLIVGGTGLHGASGLVAGNNGNTVGFGAGQRDASNNGQQAVMEQAASTLERSLLKHQQQLVFSPSLSRAFIVGGTVGVAGGLAPTPLGNNEALDTKSQLFIPSTQQPQQQQQTQNNHYSQAATTTTVSTMQQLYQQQQEHHLQPATGVLLQHKGKSLQVSAVNGEQLSPGGAANPNGAFSGTVSNAPSVPLSPASTLAAAAQPSSMVASTHQPSAGVYLSSQLQTPFLPSSGQLIVGSGTAAAAPSQHQQAPANAQQSSPQGSKTHHHHHQNSIYSNGATNLSKVPFAALGENSPPVPSGKSSLLSSPANVNPNHANANQQQAAGSTTSTSSSPVGAAMQQPSATASSASAAMIHQQHPSSSSLVSSPLSTMFDVFGAASQYLMRFKPSSLISPASFVFNTINSNHQPDSATSQASGHHLSKSFSMANGSSLLSSLAASASNSLIPLPFSASSLVANLQKSSSSSGSPMSANDRSSTSILSRFSLQNNNNSQRREDVCGRTIQTPQRRIIGGEGARYGEFPYQVHIKIAKHQCGGALVDKQSIVTAAHCVYHFITRAPVNKLQIVIGAYDIEDEQYQELPPQYFKVNKVKLHPNFRFSASHPDRYDIAILKLDKPVKYTDNVLPVCLPNKDLKFENMVGTVTGFGKTDPSLSNRYGTRLLQKVDVPIIENNECERWHRTRGIDLKIFPEMMCAGYEDGLKDACVGDSGGPLVVKTSASGSNGSGGVGGGSRWTLAGITSAGFGCAQSRQPGIYHRVSHTVDWILENLD